MLAEVFLNLKLSAVKRFRSLIMTSTYIAYHIRKIYVCGGPMTIHHRSPIGWFSPQNGCHTVQVIG